MFLAIFGIVFLVFLFDLVTGEVPGSPLFWLLASIVAGGAALLERRRGV